MKRLISSLSLLSLLLFTSLSFARPYGNKVTTSFFVGNFGGVENSMIISSSYQDTEVRLPQGDPNLRALLRSYFRNGGEKALILSTQNPNLLIEQWDALTDDHPADLVSIPGLAKLTPEQRLAVLPKIQEFLERSRAHLVLDLSFTTPPQEQEAFLNELKQSPLQRVVIFGPDLKENSTGLAIPSSGALLGLLSRIDRSIGPWHSFGANTPLSPDEAFLTRAPSSNECARMAELPLLVNCFRSHQERIIPWGIRRARQDNPEKRYFHLMRFEDELTRGIGETLQKYIFEPKTEEVLKRIKQEIEWDLYALFELGAFVGETPQDAFYVRTDSTEVHVGWAPIRPREFKLMIFKLANEL